MKIRVLAATMLLAAASGSAVWAHEAARLQEVEAETVEAGDGHGYGSLSGGIPAVRSYVPSMLHYYPAPHYDCYSHGRGRLECYPGFRERHYRRPYNYRVRFDYPWHEDIYRSFPDACPVEDCGENVEPVPAALGHVKASTGTRQARTPRRDLSAPR